LILNLILSAYDALECIVNSVWVDELMWFHIFANKRNLCETSISGTWTAPMAVVISSNLQCDEATLLEQRPELASSQATGYEQRAKVNLKLSVQGAL
jgi:hypothetical protein